MEKLDVTKMSVTRCLDEIEYLDIDILDISGKTRRISVGDDIKSAWENIRPMLRKANGEHVDSRDIKKHKNDILRIAMEFMLEKTDTLPENVYTDMKDFIEKLAEEPFDKNLLNAYGLTNGDVVARLQQLYL